MTPTLQRTDTHQIIAPTRHNLDELRARFPLIEFVSGYVALQPFTGDAYRGLCPFHQEKTPSFVVHPAYFKCHGCGAKGDLFAFVQQMEHLSFSQAVWKLAGGRMLTPRPAQVIKPKSQKKTRTLEQELARSWIEPLDGSPGAYYLLRRGVTLDAGRAGKVRYARQWYGNASVLFPIVSRYGDLVAVQGRAISGEDKMTKGPKKSGVFATVGALEAGRLAEGVAICEAPLDALSLLQLEGIPAIAVCGSDLTPWVPLAARGSVQIATDADVQGDADFEEWAPLFEERGVRATRLRPPLGKDWNEYLQQQNRL